MPIDQKYRDMVDAKLAANSSEIFGNFSTEHAGYIIAQFISKAEKSIEILSGGFADSFYDGISVCPLLEQAAERIKRNGGKIRIITIDGIRSKHLTDMAEEINKNCNCEDNENVIVYLPASCDNPEKMNHYMVVDDMRYRLEEPHEFVGKGDAPKCVKAEICCNGPQKAALLLQRFNSAWSQLTGDAQNG